MNALQAVQLAVTMLKTGMPEYDVDDVLEVLEAALTEPVQEPVATMTVREDMGADFKFSRAHTLQPGQQFYLYATPLAEEHPCNPHPKAPHGFMRNASHTEDRYVCECEAWDPWEAGYQAGMESAMRMESESAHILGANPDSSQDTGRAP